MKVRGVCVGCKRSADANLRCIMHMKFNALKFCAIILCDWRRSGVKRRNSICNLLAVEFTALNFTR